MTLYLLVTWLPTIDDSDIRISVMSLLEMRRGWEVRSKRDPIAAAAGLTKLAGFEQTFKDRIIPVDAPIAAEWARLIGQKDKHRDGLALAATARVRGLILVTRNVKDFGGRGVKVLNPFNTKPAITIA